MKPTGIAPDCRYTAGGLWPGGGRIDTLRQSIEEQEVAETARSPSEMTVTSPPIGCARTDHRPA
jgi:hypothetical protein